MNKTTIGALVIGVVLLLTVIFYFSSVMMPFGMGTSEINSEMNEVGKHSDELESYEISPGATVKRMRSGKDVVLLDVRTPEEYEETHLQDTLLLPIQTLSQQSLEEIGLGADSKDKEIILYCRSGARSKTAYNIMTSLGYTNLKVVSGGMIHWEEDKYPLTETGPYTGLSVTDNVVTTENSDSGAKIVLNRTLHDFGEITQYGGTVQTDFVVGNGGKKTLEVGDITTSCSCTSATISDVLIEPGETAQLNVVFDPDFHAEPLDVFKRTVFILTNDSNTPEAEVSVQVDILEGI